MKYVSLAFMVVLCGALFVLAACSAQQVATTANTVKDVATAASSMLPPPFGVIAGLAAGLAGIVATYAASKVKGAALAAGVPPNPLMNFLSSHSWIFPSISALVGLANTMGWIHVSPAELGTLTAALGVATVGHVALDGHAEAQAPVPAAAPAAAPAATA